jgi:two-component system, NarL family, nitrate/nitrite response regulator NarL
MMNSPRPRTTIALIHPSRLFAEGLRSLLENTQYEITFIASSFGDMKPEPDKNTSQLIVLTGGRSAMEIAETARAVHERLPSAYIIAIGATEEPYEVLSVLEAGARGYLREAMTIRTLIMAIELVLQNETILPSAFIKSISAVESAASEASLILEGDAAEATVGEEGRNASNVRLSERERAILLGLVEGAPNKVIAQRLKIREATVKVHVKAILRKISAQNRTQAAIWAIKHLALDRANLSGHDGMNGHL